MSILDVSFFSENTFYIYATFAYIFFSVIIFYFIHYLLKIRLRKALFKARRAKNKAEKSNQLKSAFIANMSHEIRTPLNAIVGFSDIISQTNDPTERKEYMKIIATSNQLLLKLIDDILDMSKIEAGTLNFSYTEVDINAMLFDIHQQFIIKNHNPNIQVKFTDKLPELIIRTDRCRISQVMTNFLNNALKFTKQGSITFGYRLCPNKDIYFFVKDTGIGIPKDKTEEVFERFIRLNEHMKGTGLGLSICRVIIEHLKGHIGVKSEEGKGSEFWFRLPSAVIVKMEEGADEIKNLNLGAQKIPFQHA